MLINNIVKHVLSYNCKCSEWLRLKIFKFYALIHFYPIDSNNKKSKSNVSCNDLNVFELTELKHTEYQYTTSFQSFFFAK